MTSPIDIDSPPGRIDWLLSLACVVIVVGGLKVAAPLLVPVLIAGSLSVVALPFTQRIERLGVRPVIAITAVLVLMGLAVMSVPLVIGVSLSEFEAAMPVYEERLRPWVTEWSAHDGLGAQLRGWGIDIPELEELYDRFGTEGAFLLAAGAAGGLIGAVSTGFVIILLMVFMLFELRALPGKLSRAYPNSGAGDTFAEITRRVGGYASVKTVMSLLTGVIVFGFNVAFGVDFPLLWGFVAFAFNFIPNIGSIIAGIPPVLLAGIQHGGMTMLGVWLCYLAVNIVIGSLLDPRIMGQKVGLSTLVVFLSLLFWGWVLGPVGVLLSVPLTVVVQISLEHTTAFQSFAVLLGPTFRGDLLGR